MYYSPDLYTMTDAVDILAKLYAKTQAELTEANTKLARREKELKLHKEASEKTNQILIETLQLAKSLGKTHEILRSNLQKLVIPTLKKYPEAIVDDRGDVIVVFEKHLKNEAGALIKYSSGSKCFTVYPTLNKKPFHINDLSIWERCSCKVNVKTIEEAFVTVENLRKIIPVYLTEERLAETKKGQEEGNEDEFLRFLRGLKGVTNESSQSVTEDEIEQSLKKAFAGSGIEVEVLRGKDVLDALKKIKPENK